MPNPETLSTTIFIEKILRKAGAVVLEYYGSKEILRTKDHQNDVVTQADFASQKILIEAINSEYPDHGIVAEEEGGTQNIENEWVWYLDPLDGTRNFSTQTPLFGVMVALTHNKVVVASGIFLPVFNEMYLAEKGKGAWLNGKRIFCSLKSELPGSYGTGLMGMSERSAAIMQKIRTGVGQGVWTNSITSAAVSSVWTAAGRRDWYVSQASKDWDYAPGVLLLEEAGCKVSTLDGKPWTLGSQTLVAGNPKIHEQLISILSM